MELNRRMLYLMVPIRKPLRSKDFINLNKELQEVCDKYNLGDLLVYSGGDEE